VALLNAADKHHTWTRTVLDDVEAPMATCEAVLSEACFLLRRSTGGQGALLELVARGIVTVTFSLAAELTAVRKLMDRYSSVPMSLADACLRMSELDPRATVIALDSDFKIYRRNGRQALRVLLPRERARTV
jgi:hypothetical protein